MANITLHGQEIATIGDLPEVGTLAPAFTLIDENLEPITLADFAGTQVILNIVPSLDTSVCALSAKAFLEKLPEHVILITVSRDTPFVFKRYIETHYENNKPAHVLLGADLSHKFGEDYSCTIHTGALSHLLSRAVVIINAQGEVSYIEQVPEIAQEPDYARALQHISTK